MMTAVDYTRSRSRRMERLDSDTPDFDDLPMLPGNPDSSLELTPQINIDMPVERKKRVEFDPFEQHGHLLKSGPLGRCNDPFCTTCPSYFHSKETKSKTFSDRQLRVRSALMRGAKDFRSKCMGNLFFFVPGILNPHTKIIQWWNKFFVISCLVAIFVDPLFFFLLAANQEQKCIYTDRNFALAVTVFRTVTDLFYFGHMLLQFRVAYVESREIGAGELVDDPKKIARNYLSGWFLVDAIAVLPLPQIIIWFVVPLYLGKADYFKNVIRITVLVQYFPRMIRFLPLLSGDTAGGFIFETAWANFVINLLMYLLAGHLVGSTWYLFGLQRVNQCLHEQCFGENSTCLTDYLDCGYGERGLNNSRRQEWVKNTTTAACFNAGITSFDYGIYKTAVSVVTLSQSWTKYIYALFWGFQQISTLAGNQTPSLFIGEVVFVLGVTALGLFLFALLIGNMQNFLQSLSRRKLEMQLRRYDAEGWMARRKLPINMRRKVRQAERLKWASTRGVDEEEFLDSLPEDLHKEIRRFLCFDLVKKVGIFNHMEEHVLDAICELLKPKVYIAGSDIMRFNFPLERMIFIVRGNLVSCGDKGDDALLKEGDFCGEELLVWCLEQNLNTAKEQNNSHAHAPRRVIPTRRMGQHAVSSRQVTCVTNVEAFTIEVADLEKLVKSYTRDMRSSRVQGAIRYASPYWRSWAAQCIQVAWRYRKRKLMNGPSPRVINGSSHWRQL